MGSLPVDATDLRGIPMKDKLRRVTGGGAAVAVMTLSPMALTAPAHAAPPPDCPAYAVSATTETSVSVSPDEVDPGQTFTATATVTTDGQPVTGGEVRFKYAKQSSGPVAVVGGQASADFTAKRGRIQLFANYTGQCLANSAAVGTSRDRATVVAGVEAFRGENGNAGGANRPGALAGVSGGAGALPGTGSDSQTELLGLLGLGLLGTGAITLAVRRRSQA